MGLIVYNTLKRKKEAFVPLIAGRVGMYVCGVTVYDVCHVGHARVMVVFDVIYRWLRELGFDVEYVRNFTDVDDKIIKRAAQRGIGIDDLTNDMIAAFHKDIDALGCIRPTHEPRATAHMDDMIVMIEKLVAAGYAYVGAAGDVLYAVRNFDGYGQLSGKNIDDLEAGSRVDVDEGKRDPLDFVLWKMAKAGEPAWDSPWGKGRPGWHIECSAMSCGHLGETFDIHGGGMDLKFPHHENEIAQAQAATGGAFARYWLHNGFVNINAEKMSKSLGNFFTIREVTEKYHPEVLRMFMLGTHYRSPLDFSDAALDTAKAGLDRLYETKKRLDKFGMALDINPSVYDIPDRFAGAMNDDFNTPEALAVLFDYSKSINRLMDSSDRRALQNLAANFISMCGLLGIVQKKADAWFQGLDDKNVEAIEARINNLIVDRLRAKQDRDFARADAIRDELAASGIVLEDSPSGTTWKKL
ncbi:MAG: cysteine--tRNA ligase [Mariprofundaceae bacterium]|nr:cysteine--tRNA ligase [Mariprofundaceae bacterium]